MQLCYVLGINFQYTHFEEYFHSNRFIQSITQVYIYITEIDYNFKV